MQPRHRELGAAQPAGAAAVALPTDGGADHLPHLHRQPHQAGLPVRTRLLHRLQRGAQGLPHLPADHPRAHPAVRLSAAARLGALRHPRRALGGRLAAGSERGPVGAVSVKQKQHNEN